MATEKRILNRIKVVLAEKHRTSLWLSIELGINKSTVSKWCTNEIQPTVGNLFMIAEALDVNVRELLVNTK